MYYKQQGVICPVHFFVNRVVRFCIFVIAIVLLATRTTSVFATDNTVTFTSPSPLDGSTVTSDPTININSTDSSEHYVFNDINSSLIGWWRGENNGSDDSSIGSTAVWSGTPAYIVGKYGQAFHFDGSNYISIPDSDTLDGSTFTVSTWANFQGATVGWNRILSKKNYSSDNDGWEITLWSGTQSDVYISGSGSNSLHVPNCIGTNWTSGGWHHIVAAYTPTGVTVYCDGIQKTGSGQVDTIVPNTHELVIGRVTGENSDNNWLGYIDDTILFNRTLSSDEVLSLHNASTHAYHFALTDLPLGSNTIKAHLSSLNGSLHVSDTRSFTNNSPPKAPIASPGSGAYTESQSVTLTSLRENGMVYSLSPIPVEGHCTANEAISSYSSYISVSVGSTLYTRACNDYGDTDASFVYTQMTAADPPTNVTRVSGGYADFVLGWTRPVNDGGSISNYAVEYRDATDINDFYWYPQWYPSTQTDVTNYSFSTGYFRPIHTYQFRVVSYNDIGYSTPSEVYEYTFPVAPSYNVSSCQDLQNIKNDLYGNYTLTKDIDCAETSTWNTNGEGGYFGFEPLGDTSVYFNGTFEGGNHTISNLYINRNGYNYIGLFGTVDTESTITNLGLINADVTASNYAGILAGGLAGTVTNCYSTGQINGYNQIGGLVGRHVDTGNFQSSPLVYTWNGTKYDYIGDVGKSLARNVVGNDYMPIDGSRLAPKDGTYSVNISQEYNEIVYYDELALKTFDHAPGYGIATSLQKSKSGQFYTVKDAPTNPLISCVDAFGNDCVTNLKNNDDLWSKKGQSEENYWTMNFGSLVDAPRILLIVQGAEDGYAKNKHFVQVKDAQGNWVDVYDNSTLTAMGGAPRKQVFDLTGKFPTSNYDVRVGYSRTRINYFAVDTTPQQTYTETTYHPTRADLHFFGYTAIKNDYFADHDYYSVSSTPKEVFADQVGNFTKYGDVSPLLQSTNDQFVVMHHGDQMSAEFAYVAPADGMERDFVLYNYDMFKHAKLGSAGRSVEPMPYKGMTKYPLVSPQAYPLTDSNKEYLATWNTRTILGSTKIGSTIINSHSSAAVNGQYNIGGLVGWNQKLITGSYATGDVTLDNGYAAGGLVGFNTDVGEIRNSYATGKVTSSQNGSNMGGLVGENDNQNAVIRYSYATGKVTGSENSYTVGGLVGYNNGNIFDTYTTSVVSGFEFIGGFAGQNYGQVSNSYSTGNVTALLDYAGGFIANDRSGVSNSFSTGDVTSADGANYVGGFIGQGTEFDYSSNEGGNDYWYGSTQSMGIADGRNESSSATKVESADYFKGAGVTAVAPFVNNWNFDSVWKIMTSYPELVTNVYVTVDANLGTENIDTNIGEILDPASATHLYFYKPGFGKIEFGSTLDLTDPAVVAWLQDLGSKLDLTVPNQVSLDAETIKALIDTQATITLYNVTFDNPVILVNGQTDIHGIVTDIVYDKTAHTLTFHVAHFTSYKAVAADTSHHTSSPSQSSSSDASTPMCTDTAPSSIPDLFQVNVTDTDAKVFFTPISNSDGYYVSFSTMPTAEEHGAQITLAREGVQNYTVHMLKPQTTYYFKVRGQNGCMPGEWSSIIKVKTTPKGQSNSAMYYKQGNPVLHINVDIEPTPESTVLGISTPRNTPIPQITHAAVKPSAPAPTIAPKKNCILIWCWQ
ncbi:MAG: LamG-like jellyroll fold domain-containing protein [Candidatus Roizmanbacteria bacterium]